MGQIVTKKKGFDGFYERWIPFLLEIMQKAGWLVGMLLYNYNYEFYCKDVLIIMLILVNGKSCYD